MFKISKSILPVVFILVMQFNAFSQVRFSGGPSLGITIPSGDYSGSTIDYYNGTKYGLKTNVNFGAVLKAHFPYLTLRTDLYYTSLSNSGNSEPGKGFIEVKQSVFHVGVGPELQFKIPGSIATPYINVELLLAFFSGETTFQDVARVPSGTFSMGSESRTGFGFGAGAQFALGKYALDFGFKYNFLNVLGRSFSGGNDRLNSYIALNDDMDPLYANDINKHPIGTARAINVIQINAAFLFGF